MMVLSSEDLPSQSTGSIAPALESGLQYMSAIHDIEIFGVSVDVVDTASTLAAIDGFLNDGKPHMVVTADTSCVVIAQNDPELKEIVNTADLVTPDGIGLVWAAQRLGTPLQERVSGVDMVELLCARGATHGRSVFLLGSAPGIAAEAGERLKKRYPGLRIAGTHHGFFNTEESEHLVKTIHDLKPDFLFVALGIPIQEKWIKHNLNALDVPVSMGVGGSFDVISGNVRRAPEWMQRHGLEWVYRVVSNPRKFKKAMTLPVFAWMVLTAGLRKR